MLCGNSGASGAVLNNLLYIYFSVFISLLLLFIQIQCLGKREKYIYSKLEKTAPLAPLNKAIGDDKAG